MPKSLTIIIIFLLLSQLLVLIGSDGSDCLAANNSRPTPQASQGYGEISDTIQKIEDTLSNGAHNLSDTEYQDYQSRLERLKTDAKIDISGGGDASSIIAPAASLHNDLSSRLRDNSSLIASEKKQIERELVKVDELLSERSSNLTGDQHSELKQVIADLKTRASGKLTADGAVAALLHDVHQVYMEIISKSWVKLGSSKKGLGDSNEGNSSGAASTASDSGTAASKNEATASPQANPSSEVHRGHVEESTQVVPTTAPNAAAAPKRTLPRKPMISIPKQMELVENELITLHDRGRLGTFDMDLFTSKLLAIKKNWNVMVQKTGALSFRQESTLRLELEHLNQSISDRINGLD